MLITRSPGAYRGRDRRGRASERSASAAVRCWLLPSTTTLVVGAVLLLALRPHDIEAVHTHEMLRCGAALLLAVSGSLAVTTWRLSGRLGPLYAGCALLSYAAVLIVLEPLAGVLGLPTLANGVDVAGQLAGAAIALPLIFATTRGAEVDARARPQWWGLASIACSLALGVVYAGQLPPTSSGVHSGVDTLLLATTALEAALAARLALAAKRSHVALPAWLSMTLLLFASALALHALPTPHQPTAALWGAAVLLAASVGTVLSAAADLRAAHRAQQAQGRLLGDLLTRTEEQLATQSRLHAERDHDLRNAVGSVRSAYAALTWSGSMLDTAKRRDIEESVTAELERMSRLIEPPREPSLRPLDLAQVLGPVLVTAGTRGVRIDSALTETVVADRFALAEVVDNLLRNAGTHAPEARVTVTSERVDSLIEIRVADHGPGVSDDELDALLGWGARGASTSSAGEGLGLAVSQRLMLEQRGSLRLTHTDGGGLTVVLTLPAAAQVPPQRATQEPAR